MELNKRIAHLWNVSKFFENIQNPEVAKLRMHYVRCCRELSERVELPKQIFGAATLCPQCGSPWASTKHKTRIAPRKKSSRTIDSLIRRSLGASRLPKYHQTLIQKYEKNRSNKIVKECSVCAESTKFSLGKPQRQKAPKTNPFSNSILTESAKKKKRRTKDRSAGLNLSGIKTPDVNLSSNKPNRESQTPLVGKNNINVRKLDTLTPLAKPAKINLSKLKGIINTTTTPSKKSKLHTFLQELR